jgi:hypothetical protein
MSDDEAPTRDQLLEARENIKAQLTNLRAGNHSPGKGWSAGRDYDSLIATFEQELEEIDAILGIGESP